MHGLHRLAVEAMDGGKARLDQAIVLRDFAAACAFSIRC
jgi:hypothetical protein